MLDHLAKRPEETLPLVSVISGDVLERLHPGKVVAHRVSADLALGRGFAEQVKALCGPPVEARPVVTDSFGVGTREARKRADPVVGTCLVQGPKETRETGLTVVHLVTKRLCMNKPPPEKYLPALQAALLDASTKLPSGQTVCCPKLGCGLDRQHWPAVEATLKRVARHTGLRFVVYER